MLPADSYKLASNHPFLNAYGRHYHILDLGIGYQLKFRQNIRFKRYYNMKKKLRFKYTIKKTQEAPIYGASMTVF